ncbi:hypothetical protein QOT17_024037 [Balamuthia mandrillaris]
MPLQQRKTLPLQLHSTAGRKNSNNHNQAHFHLSNVADHHDSQRWLKVIGGWVLHRDQQHKQTSSKLIFQFIAKHFHTTMSDAWVSKTMQHLYLTSHQAATKDRKYRKLQTPNSLHRFLLQLQDTINIGFQPSCVVAVDTMRFTHPEVVWRTFGPEGSGQPSLWSNTWKWKMILYEGLVMNGEVLPPVIFTNCLTVPQDVEADSNAKEIYVPHLNQLTGELTLR